MGPVWYTSKTWKIPIKLWHNAATTAESSLRIWVFSNTILTIQLQKVSEKSETMMRVTGLDLVESAYNIEEPQPKRIQTLEGFLADFEGSSENDLEG